MSEEVKNNGDSKDLQTVEAFIRGKGADGATAAQIVSHLGLPTDDDNKKASFFKVRRLARKVIDTNKGDRTKKVGKNKVYTLS
jgi:hypothetical protein